MRINKKQHMKIKHILLIQFLVLAILLFLLVDSLWAATGDRLEPSVNAIWQMAAVGLVQETIDVIDNMSADWRAWQNIEVIKGWLLVAAAQPVLDGGTGHIYQQGTYSTFLGKFQYFSDGDSITMQVNPIYAAPENVTKVGDTISCDVPDSGTIKLYKLISQTYFIEDSITGVVNVDRLEFTSVPNGTYVLGFSDDLNRFPSTLKTVSL